MGPSDRVLVISDTHLGRPRAAARSAAALRPLWQECDHLIVNGDVAEVHHPHHRSLACRETLTLFDLCEEDGVHLTLLSGNHDPYLSDIRHLRLAAGRVFMTHGDVLHPAIAPWSPAAGRMRQAHRDALAALEPEVREELEQRLSAAQHASHAEWLALDELEEEARHSSILAMLLRPWTIVQVLHYWRLFPELAARFVEKHAPDARFVLVGHTHHAGIREVRDRIVINTGSYGFPGRPLAVRIEPERLTVWRVVSEDGLYRLDREPLADFLMPPALAQPGASWLEPAAAAAANTRPGRARPSAAAT